jgi:hypothetical protein
MCIKQIIFNKLIRLVNITHSILSSGFLIKIFPWRFRVACTRRQNPAPDGGELKKNRWELQRQSEAPKPEMGMAAPLKLASTPAH